MGNRKIAVSLVCALALTMLAACGGSPAAVSTVTQQVTPGVATAFTSAIAAATSVTTAVTESTEATAVTGSDSTAATLAENAGLDDAGASDVLDITTATHITLNGDAIKVDGKGVTVDGSVATITAAGTYSISGSLADGQLIVNTKDKEPVNLILNGVTLSSSSSAPIAILDAEKAVIVLADGSKNTLSDGESYVFADPADDEPNAAIFSKSDLTINGSGSLTVAGNYNDGIASKDGLIIAGGTIIVNAVDDGIRGKDYLVIRDGQITVKAGGDGLKSDNAEDTAKGYISIENGALNITTGGDAIQAETDVAIADGTITLSSGGGNQGSLAEDASAKGIKGLVSVVIDGGTFAIDSADDAIHSNNSIIVNGGSFVIATGDDGLHADATLKVNGGDIRITDSYEGIESAVITINDGDIHVVSSDDGLNVAGGIDSSGMGGRPGPGGRPGRGGGAGQDAFTYSGSQYLYINGGYTVVDAAGDGIDVNGAIEMTDGVVIVNGPTQQMNGALDYDAYFKVTGGFLVAAGSSGMAQAPSASSTQNSLLLNLNGTTEAGALLHIQTSDGQGILTFASTKPYQSIAFSSPELVQGATYDVYYGGSTTGTAQDGLYQDGEYTPGTEYTSFTVSSAVTTIGGRVR